MIKIGRGLDFYQRPTSWFDIGSNDLTLRKCLETKVDIYPRGEVITQVKERQVQEKTSRLRLVDAFADDSEGREQRCQATSPTSR